MEEVKFQLLSSIIKDPVNFISLYRSLGDIKEEVDDDLINVGQTIAKILLNFQKTLSYVGLSIPNVVDMTPKVFSLLPDGRINKEKNINNLLDQQEDLSISLQDEELKSFCDQLVKLSKKSNTSLLKIEQINLFEGGDLLPLIFDSN